MRRKDREVGSMDDILSIIDKCDIIRIGLADGLYPYIVPLNFGYSHEDGELCFYVHGAMAGRKYELMMQNGVCSFEMDKPYEMVWDCDGHKVTTEFESVMGRAKIDFLEDEQKRVAMERFILARYPSPEEFEYNVKVLERTAVAKLTVTEITGKANPKGIVRPKEQ